ncbi:hypothetical protein Cgig2_010662 [Carnegiea gigantea]|uniref:Uncharacterized protein n=1 Tax=Carnegiea gigantea TaxID=171969 RepID=A0A9Q1GY50_9CARY|nr:hypothetical protein Cgig2_010662 [Carnegiea gigantea]
MTTCSFSSLATQLNEAQTKAIRSMRFASFLKVDLNGSKNQYCGKSVLKYVKDVNWIASLAYCQFALSKLISSVRHYKESKATKGTFIVLIWSSQSFNRSSNQTRMMVVFPFSLTLALREPDSEAQISAATSVADASVNVKKEEQRENVLMNQAKKEMKKDDCITSFSLGLELSQSDSQSPVPQTTFVPDPKIAGEKHDGNEDDDDVAPLLFLLRNTSQANRDLSFKKSTENKSKAGDKPSFKKGDFICKKSKLAERENSNLGPWREWSTSRPSTVDRKKESKRELRLRDIDETREWPTNTS